MCIFLLILQENERIHDFEENNNYEDPLAEEDLMMHHDSCVR